MQTDVSTSVEEMARPGTGHIVILLGLAVCAMLGQAAAEPRNVPKYKQRGANDCGPAAVASALHYWKNKGKKVGQRTIDETHDSIKKASKTDESGTQTANLDDAVDDAVGGTNLDGHWASPGNSIGSFDYLQQEWDKGQIIILNLKVTDAQGNVYGHYVVVNDLPSGLGQRPVQVMNPATGEYETYQVDDSGGKLTFPYQGGVAQVWGIYSISPTTKVESEADTLTNGDIEMTYTIYTPGSSDSTQKAKDFHIVASDTGKIEGLPPGWKKRTRPTRRGWATDLYDSCQTSGLPNGHEITITYKGKKIRKIKCRVSVTKTGDPANPPDAPDRIWHDFTEVICSAADFRPPNPPTWTAATVDQSAEVVLAWSGASDNVGVDGYAIYDHTVSRPDTSISDTFHVLGGEFGPNCLHRLSVAAYDSVGNHSQDSRVVSFYVDEAGAQFTDIGSPVEVDLFCPELYQALGRDLRLVFASVLAPGETRASYFFGTQTNPPLDYGGTTVIPPSYYISTTAVTSGSLALAIPYDSAGYVGAEGPPALYQLDGNFWVEITDSVNLDERVVYGSTSLGLTTFGAGTFAVGFKQVPFGDVGLAGFGHEVEMVVPYRFITPTVTAVNPGPTTESFAVVYELGGVATDTQYVFDLAPGARTEIWFGSFAPLPGQTYQLKAYTTLPEDNSHSNDTAYATIGALAQGWHEVTPMPSAPSGRPVKRGGWLAYCAGNGLVYAAKGNKTTDFYSYDPRTGVWTLLSGMPHSTHPVWSARPPRKGARGACDAARYIYVTQGNNSLGFWRYDIQTDSWRILPDVPAGLSGKKVKGGTDMVYVEDPAGGAGFVYLLKGYRAEFYRFNLDAWTWETLDDAPYIGRAKFDKGSWVARTEDAVNDLYVSQAKYHGFFAYDLKNQVWRQTPLTGMPFIGSTGRRKKSKDGGSADWYHGQVWALKGGNTQEFWCYDVASDVWNEVDTVPAYGSTGRRRRVKHGADIVSLGNGVFYALKGNKTLEFWRYIRQVSNPAPAERAGATGDPGRAFRLGIQVQPNPVEGRFAVIKYGLPAAGPAELAIFDVTGRVVERRALVAKRSGMVSIDISNLSVGVYLVRVDALGGYTDSRKLVIQR